MRILIACEFSGVVRDAFIKKGHEAVSCDLLPTESPGPHIQADVVSVLDAGWDMMIAHPPCTHLSVSGARWFKDKKVEQEAALRLVHALLHADIDKIALENPVSIISTKFWKPAQTIQPWQFGHSASKRTCLWLKNLPKLIPTNIVQPDRFIEGKPRFENQTDSGQNKIGPRKSRWKDRSTTYQGIADAMADQWNFA